MRVDLTDDQLQQLKPLENDATAAHGLGLTGMIVAQIFPRLGYMTVGFMKHRQAEQLVHEATEGDV